MPLALCLLVLTALGGTSLTYFYDNRSSILERLAIGTATGLAAIGLVSFSIAWALGLGSANLILSAIISALSFLAFVRKSRREQALSDVRHFSLSIPDIIRVQSVQEAVIALAYLGLLLVLFWIFQDALFYRDGAAYTGVQNDYGDLMLHLSIIARFAKGGNVPPMDPAYAGAKFTYPFLSDYISAMFVRAGASFRAAMFLEGFALAAATLVLLRRWVIALTGNRIAAVIAVLMVFFSGGLGWAAFIRDSLNSGASLTDLLLHLPHDYTITDVTFRWANSLTSLLVPQRSLLLGAPLALVVFTIFWQNWRMHETKETTNQAAETAAKTRSSRGAQQSKGPGEGSSHDTTAMIAAGIVAGLLPLAHTHTFLVVVGTAAILALLDRQWLGWALFFAVSLLVAAPQLWWLSLEEKVHFGTFFEFHFGWNSQGANPLLFWLINTGVFIPILLAALSWPRDRLIGRRHRLFYLPFALCFVIPNLFKLAPWEWDNIKVLFYWFLGSVPLVAAALAWLWNRNWPSRVIVFVLVGSLIFAGALDIFRVVSGASQDLELSQGDLEFANAVEAVTAPDALILHAPIHNDPIMVTGRQSFMGYPGHLWTRGVEPYSRGQIVSAIYAGDPEADRLISEFGIQYAVVSQAEESRMPVDADFFRKFNLVVQIESYRLYKLQ